MSQTPSSQETVTSPVRSTRDLFVRGVPEEVWDRIHINAIKSRLRLKNYLIRVLDSAQPFSAQEADR